MRVLLDTNIVIHREASYIKHRDIGLLFRCLDGMRAEKCVHPLTIDEISRHEDKRIVSSIIAKIQNYHILKTLAPKADAIIKLSENYDHNENDKLDTEILNELYSGRVDILITEDRKLIKKASLVGISTQVYTIDGFVEKALADRPDLVDYSVLSVRKSYFGNINLEDPFFDSLKSDYGSTAFSTWFTKKSDSEAYVSLSDSDKIIAFLYLKVEDTTENYSDIKPPFTPAKRLKIGTFKVSANGHKLGERFIKIIFDNASKNKVDEIYVTIFNTSEDQLRLTALLEDWGV